MSIPLWPTDLPKPTRSGYQRQRVDTRLRKQQGGTLGYRKRYSLSVKLMDLEIEVTRAQKAVFDQFFDETTQNGTLPFYMPDPATDGYPLLTDAREQILTDDGTPILIAAQLLCLFSDTMPVERAFHSEFAISFQVAVMP